MGATEKLFKFLEKYKVSERGQPHTNINIGTPKQSYNIPDEVYNRFLKLYTNCVINGGTLHFVEKPLDPSPLRVDIDFRFIPKYDRNEDVILSRESYFTDDNIDNIVLEYFKIIYSIYDIDYCDVDCYVMMKDVPVFSRGVLKDGIHLVFPDVVVSHQVQHFIRDKILQRANIIFNGIYASNDYNDIVDKAIISSNGWQMYKSCKLDCEPYEIVKVYTYSENTIKQVNNQLEGVDEDEHDDALIKVNIKHLSMRKKEYRVLQVKESIENELEDFILRITPDEERNRRYVDSSFLTDMRNIKDNRVDDEKINLTKNIVNNCIDPARMDIYDDWIRLGFVLRNLDERLLDVWDSFSMHSDKYKPGDCMQKWNSMRDDNLGLGSLIFWAKQDNPEKYEEIILASLIFYIDKSVETKSHYDVAELIAKKYGDEIKFSRGDNWYIYSKVEHRYLIMIDNLDLSSKISTEIVDNIKSRQNEHLMMSMKSDIDADKRAVISKKCEEANKLILMCKNTPFKRSVITECKILFKHDGFEATLNEQSHLVGFKNGVFDIKKGLLYKDLKSDIGFREGDPSDYITFSTNVSYKRYDPEDPIAIEINHFLSQVLPEKEVRDYLLAQFALALDGSFQQEKFFILAGEKGGGANGKSTLLNLLEKAIGDYAYTLPVAFITQKRAASNGATPEIYKTKGKRVVLMQEPNEGDKINVGKLKEMTGNDTISCRGLYKDQVEFKPQFTIFLACNYVPEVTSNDDGTWRRIRLIEFKSRFMDNPDPNKPNQFKLDYSIKGKLEKWKSTFVSMLLDIRIRLARENKIIESKIIDDATKRFYMEQDLISQFINDKVVRDDTTREILSVNDLYTEYKLWFKSNTNNSDKILRKPAFKMQINRNDLFTSMTPDSTGWYYVKLRNEDGQDAEIIDDA